MSSVYELPRSTIHYDKPTEERCKYIVYKYLLHRYDCFTAKYTTHRFHIKLHLGYE